jgi:hypothetical protein
MKRSDMAQQVFAFQYSLPDIQQTFLERDSEEKGI